MNRIFRNIVLLLLLTPCLYAAQISKIIVSGAKYFDKEDYIEWSGIKEGMKFLLSLDDSVKKRISCRLADAGFVHAVVECSYGPDTSKIDLNIKIIENEPSKIKHIIIANLKGEDSVKVYSEFDYLKGRIFNKNEVEDCIERVIESAENQGNPFMSVHVRSVNFYSDAADKKEYADLLLAVEKGKRALIDIIEIKGNESTRDYVITRETRIVRGEQYTQKKLEDIPKRLNRLKYFEPVRTPDYYFDSKNNGVLSITVKEKQTNNFDGVIGYVPDDSKAGKGYLTGLVNVSLANLFGTGRNASFHWQQYDRNSQELEIKYLEPWLLGFPFNISAGLYQKKQDTSYVQRKLDGALEYLANENLTLSLTLASEAVIPTESDYSVFTVYNSVATTTGFSIRYDSRDDIYSPTGGLYFLSSYGYRQKKIKGPSKYLTASTQTKFNMQQLTFDFAIYRSFFKNQVAALALHGRELRGSSFEISDLYLLGGTKSLRGYKENQFSGNRLLWSNLEYRFLMTRRTYFFTFFDVGYYLRNAEPLKSIAEMSGTKSGYGLGLNLETSLGVLTVSYALAKGESFSQGMIHFGIINEF